MVAFREPRARRSVACALWTGNAATLGAFVIIRELVHGTAASPAWGCTAIACAVLAFVWRDA